MASSRRDAARWAMTLPPPADSWWQKKFNLVGALGIEPSLHAPEARVLPVYYAPMSVNAQYLFLTFVDCCLSPAACHFTQYFFFIVSSSSFFSFVIRRLATARSFTISSLCNSVARCERYSSVFFVGSSMTSPSRISKIAPIFGPGVKPRSVIMIEPLIASIFTERRSEEHTSELQSQSNLVC